MKVFLIGTGTEGVRTLTAEAADAIARAELLVGAKRMLEPYAGSCKELVCMYQAERIAETLRCSRAAYAAVLFSGDTGFFSGTKNLLPLICDMDVAVLPGISSMAAFCARCGISYENMRFFTLHGAKSNIAIHAKMNRYCFFLLGGDIGAAQVCQRLCAFGLGDILVHIGTNLGYKNETILHGKPCDFITLPDETLSVLITENPHHYRYIPSAIPDTDFIRERVPMTKSEVRCNAVSLLKIAHDAICWDIGCGTGSVSVEMAFRCQTGQVFAFDCSEDAVHLTQQNAYKFGCDNITVVNGSCPDILHDYPAPDAVFIGGAGGMLDGILEEIAAKKTGIKVVLTAVSLETLSQATALFSRYSDDFDVVQIAVTRTKKVGTHTMFDAQNPVFLISGDLKCSGS